MGGVVLNALVDFVLERVLVWYVGQMDVVAIAPVPRYTRLPWSGDILWPIWLVGW